MRIEVLGVGFDNLTAPEAAERAIAMMGERKPAYAVTPNPDIVWMSRNNSELCAVLRDADLVLPDGIGIVYGAKIMGTPLRGRATGVDFAKALFSSMGREGMSLYLLGAKLGVAETAGQKLAEVNPGLRIAGTHDGYFEDDTPVVEDINRAKPDLLLVCLGAPKQELWMKKNGPMLDVGFMAGLGGVLDVFAGTVSRAPESWQRLGLEWLYRLLKEPRRIKRMYRLPLFLLAVLKKRLTG